MIARWQLDGNTAALTTAACSATIDLARPDRGLLLNLPGINQASPPLQILGVAFADRQPLEPARIDPYVRGADLVVTYGETPPHRLRSQAYWRCVPPAEFAAGFAPHVVAAFDLILSSNTSLLDSDPQTSVLSQVSSAGEMFHLLRDGVTQLSVQPFLPLPTSGNSVSKTIIASDKGETGCFIIRFPNTPFSYVEMVHPADFRASAITINTLPQTGASHVLIEHQLFHQHLEKGVILRARVRSAIMARQEDEAATLAAYQQFAATEPPLTV